MHYTQNTASEDDIFVHLQDCSPDFVPPLFEKVDVLAYSRKIRENAVTFEAWESTRLIGLVAIYLNNLDSRSGYITNVSVLKAYHGRGIALELMRRCINFSQEAAFKEVKLEVHSNSTSAVNLYIKLGFIEIGHENEMNHMLLKLA